MLGGSAAGDLGDRVFRARLADGETGGRDGWRRYGRCGGWRAGTATQHGICDRGRQRSEDNGDERQYAPIQEIGLYGAQEVGHGVTFTIAAGVEELVAAEVEAGVVAPVGEVALAVPVSPWLAGSV